MHFLNVRALMVDAQFNAEGNQVDACADCGGEDCRGTIEEAIQSLRREFNEKHQENRSDIHQHRAELAEVRGDLHELRGKIAPYLDNGQPGLFSRMSAKLDTVLDEVTELRISQGTEQGRRDVYAWLRACVGPLIVGLVLLLAQHKWG